MQFPHPDARTLPVNIQLKYPGLKSQSKEQQKIVGSLVGLAVGDALGASVEFRPRQYLVEHPVTDMQDGGTWGLQAGQWTDDTSMALCLASSLLTRHDFDPYDQMVRYKWWYRKGFLSSTGQCFDIGKTTRAALEEFSQRQNILKKNFPNETDETIDNMSYDQVKKVPNFDVVCGKSGDAGNGPLMRLAPVPLCYFRDPEKAVSLAGQSARLTHGDQKAVDACRFYAALIVAAIHGESKDRLLNERFYEDHQSWFGRNRLHDEVLHVARGSYKKKRGYEDGIRGKNYIINSLEAALWAFWSDGDSFSQGALNAVNLGDDTDTTAAIYGQLAGAYYGISAIPPEWASRLYAMNFIICVAEWLYVEGDTNRQQQQQRTASQQQQERTASQQQRTASQQQQQERITPQQQRTASQQQQQERITPQQQRTASQQQQQERIPSQQQRIVSQQQQQQQQHNQSRMASSQQNQYIGVPSSNQQNPRQVIKEYKGYDAPIGQKPPGNTVAEAFSQNYNANNTNESYNRRQKVRVDPSTMPVAGLASGQSKK